MQAMKGKIKLQIKKPQSLPKILAHIGTGLSYLREQKGFESIKEFALAHKLPLIQYWRIEKGKANLTLRSLMKLLAIHQLTIPAFFVWLRQL
jgi:hypothetical protein